MVILLQLLNVWPLHCIITVLPLHWTPGWENVTWTSTVWSNATVVYEKMYHAAHAPLYYHCIVLPLYYHCIELLCNSWEMYFARAQCESMQLLCMRKCTLHIHSVKQCNGSVGKLSDLDASWWMWKGPWKAFHRFAQTFISFHLHFICSSDKNSWFRAQLTVATLKDKLWQKDFCGRGKLFCKLGQFWVCGQFFCFSLRKCMIWPHFLWFELNSILWNPDMTFLCVFF